MAVLLRDFGRFPSSNKVNRPALRGIGGLIAFLKLAPSALR